MYKRWSARGYCESTRACAARIRTSPFFHKLWYIYIYLGCWQYQQSASEGNISYIIAKTIFQVRNVNTTHNFSRNEKDWFIQKMSSIHQYKTITKRRQRKETYPIWWYVKHILLFLCNIVDRSTLTHAKPFILYENQNIPENKYITRLCIRETKRNLVHVYKNSQISLMSPVNCTH